MQETKSDYHEDEHHEFVGKSIERVDTRDKVMGKPIFLDDIKFSGMLYGRRSAKFRKLRRCVERVTAGEE